jgi:hypothetical protein
MILIISTKVEQEFQLDVLMRNKLKKIIRPYYRKHHVRWYLVILMSKKFQFFYCRCVLHLKENISLFSVSYLFFHSNSNYRRCVLHLKEDISLFSVSYLFFHWLYSFFVLLFLYMTSIQYI